MSNFPWRAALIGFVAALFMMVLGVGLGGAGHGWVGAFFFSPVSLVLFPSAAALAFARPSLNWLTAAIIITVSYIVADVALYWMAVSEFRHFQKMNIVAPEGVVIWFLLWGAGHIAVLIGVYRQIVHIRSMP